MGGTPTAITRFHVHANAGLPVRVAQTRQNSFTLEAHPTAYLQLALVGSNYFGLDTDLVEFSAFLLGQTGVDAVQVVVTALAGLAFGGGPHSKTTQLTEPGPSVARWLAGTSSHSGAVGLRRHCTGAGLQTTNAVRLSLSLTSSRGNLRVLTGALGRAVRSRSDLRSTVDLHEGLGPSNMSLVRILSFSVCGDLHEAGARKRRASLYPISLSERLRVPSFGLTRTFSLRIRGDLHESGRLKRGVRG